MSMYRNYSTRSDCPDEFLDLMGDHMLAMTTEDLHSKGDIARELAWRDYQLKKLQAPKADYVAKAVAKLKELQECHDWEAAHGDADDLLCDLLRELGYSEVADEFDEVGKWYA